MATLTATSSGGGPHLSSTTSPKTTANPHSAGGGVHIQASPYHYRLTLTVPANKVGENLYGLPLLVEWYLSPGKVVNQAFLFTDTSNRLIGQQIRNYNATTGVLMAYVNVNVSVSSGSTFYLYYG